MMYEKCMHCINSGKICQMIVAPALCALKDLELTTNRGLQYSKQRTKNEPNPIKIKMDFTCLSFEQRENDPWEAMYNAE